jgi:NhaP-type Na+/H+ or K+/H+ antiporter
MAFYEALLLIVGLAILGAIALPRVLADKPLSLPIIYVASGVVLFGLPVGPAPPDPLANPEVAERITELLVIVALMGAGLKIDRPFDLRAWASTWRLLAVVMPLTIVATAAVGKVTLGMLGATAVLLGAVVAPTDPVLASDVQATPPTEGFEEEIRPEEQEEPVRFALTSEAGLNDGLAFPFTNLAIAMAAAAGSTSLAWLGEWALVDVTYRILVGIVAGYSGGRLMSGLIFRTPATTDVARAMEGAEALAGTLITYAATELLAGYGFIAVFVAALEMRHFEWEDEYHLDLHAFAVMVERLLVAAVLVLFGGTIVGGLFAPLSWTTALVGVALVVVVRPVAGVVGFLGSRLTWPERLIVAGYGIRGVGSFYYLSFALNEAGFAERELLVAAEELWALVGFTVLVSIILHGATASPVLSWFDRAREDPRTPVEGSGSSE